MKKDLIDILITTQREKEKYFKNWKEYSQKIKKIAKKLLEEVRVLVFGSIVKNEWGPKSDIDVLIISKNLPKDPDRRREIRTKIKAKIDPFSPYQFHLATPSEFENWYKNFIKEEYLEI
jgi:predicted nucleotidyltransferase